MWTESPICSNSGRHAYSSIGCGGGNPTFSVLIFHRLVSSASVADLAWVTVGRSGGNGLMRCVFSAHDKTTLVCLPASNSGDRVRRLNAKGKVVNSVQSDIVPRTIIKRNPRAYSIFSY